MADSNNVSRASSAGPSSTPKPRRQKKRQHAKESSPLPPTKISRIDSPDHDMGAAGVDPMEALENGNTNPDPMEGLERETAEGGDGADVRAENGNGNGDGEQALPVRADEFETEAEREIEASKGLDGAAGEEGKMKLVHQVRHQVSSSISLFFSLELLDFCD